MQRIVMKMKTPKRNTMLVACRLVVCSGTWYTLHTAHTVVSWPSDISAIRTCEVIIGEKPRYFVSFISFACWRAAANFSVGQFYGNRSDLRFTMKSVFSRFADSGRSQFSMSVAVSLALSATALRWSDEVMAAIAFNLLIP